MITEEGRERVAVASAYLDELKPDWWSCINPYTLNMMDSRKCICGQNGLNWREHAEALGWTGVFASCREEWLEAIAERSAVRELVPA